MDFGSLESDDYTATKICIAMVYNSFDIKVSIGENLYIMGGYHSKLNRLFYCIGFVCIYPGVLTVAQCMAGETGGIGRDLPLWAPLIPYPGWDPGDPIYNENGPLYFSWTVFQQLQ